MLHVVINNCMLHVFVPRKVPISDYPGYAEWTPYVLQVGYEP